MEGSCEHYQFAMIFTVHHINTGSVIEKKIILVIGTKMCIRVSNLEMYFALTRNMYPPWDQKYKSLFSINKNFLHNIKLFLPAHYLHLKNAPSHGIFRSQKFKS